MLKFMASQFYNSCIPRGVSLKVLHDISVALASYKTQHLYLEPILCLQQKLLNEAPVSLAADRVMAEPRPGVEQNFFTKAVLKIAGFYSQESQQLMAAKAWYSAVTEQAEDQRLYQGQ